MSSTASFDDLVIAVSSPDHVPTENGYPANLSEFPCAGVPVGRKLQESSLVVSTSDICLESKDSPIKSPTIMVDVFDDDVLSDGCMSPTTQLHAANNDTILDTNSAEIISKLENSAAATEIIVPDVDVLSQEILNHISTVGMTLDEDLFARLPGEDSPIILRKNMQHEEQAFPSATVTSTPQAGVFPSSNHQDEASHDISVLTRSNHGSSFSLISNRGGSPHSTPTSRHRYQDSHQLARKMASSNTSAVSNDPEHYHVHISPHTTSKNQLPKQVKPSVASSNLNNNPRNSSKFSQYDRHPVGNMASPSVARQWREVSPQNSDEPNEEFVLPPPPQFQSNDITSTPYDTTHINDTDTVFANRHSDSPRGSSLTRSSSSVSQKTTSRELTTSKLAKSLSDRKHCSASGLLSVDNGEEEEVLLTDMLKSLDQMAEEKYHEELRRKLSTEKTSTLPGAGTTKEEKPEKKKQKRKPKRRSTVGIFSFDDLIRQSIREDRASGGGADSPPKTKDDNKVKKLAREYSKRVKDRPVYNKKRFSVHSYENFSSSSGTNTPELKDKEPQWMTIADEHKMVHSQGPPLSPSADPKRRLPSISSGAEVDYHSPPPSRSVSAKSSSSISNQSTRGYTSPHSSPKINKFKSTPVVRTSSPIRSRIEGFEMLSQPKDEMIVPNRAVVSHTEMSKTRNPSQFPAKGKSFVTLNHMKSQEDLHSTSNGSDVGQQHEQAHNLTVRSRQLSKSHGSLNPSRTVVSSVSTKQYRGLSVFSPDKVDESDVIYHPPGGHSGGRDEFENIRVKGGFKGWVRNLVDKFSK